MVRIQTRGIAIDRRLQAGQLQHERWQRPDTARIAAMSGAVAVNLLALLLLLLPMSIPPPSAPVEARDNPDAEFLPRPPVVEIATTLPQPREEVVPVQQPRRTQVPADAEPAPVLADRGESAPVQPPQAEAVVGEPTIAPPQAAAAPMRLEYVDAPPPAYPRDAQRRRLEGTVMLQVLVGTDGRPLEVLVHASSGHRSLDEAARRHVLKRWIFRPAMQDGRAVQAIGLVPVAFELR